MARERPGFDVAIGVTRFIMYTHGIWPGFISSKVGIARFSFLPAAFMILVFINVPQTIQLFFVRGDLNVILNILTLANVPIGIALVKLLVASFNQNVLQQLIVLLSDDWRYTTKKEELDVMWRQAKMSRKFSIICIVLGESTVIAYTLRVVFSSLTSPVVYKEDRLIRPMYFPAKFPYDVQSSPNYEITWALQLIATTLSAGAFSSIDALFISLVFHLCGQLINLQVAFREFGEIEESKAIGILDKLVKKHRQINEFADIIEYSFNIMFLFQVLSFIILLCLQGYLFVVIVSREKGILLEMIFMLIFTMCFSFSVFVYCYVAELLREESLQLGNAIFYSKWYNLSAKHVRLLIIPLLRVRKPLEISAGKFGVLSLNFFCNIVRTSAGYMSVLLAARDKLS